MAKRTCERFGHISPRFVSNSLTPKHDFNPVTLFVEFLVIEQRNFTIFGERMHGVIPGSATLPETSWHYILCRTALLPTPLLLPVSPQFRDAAYDVASPLTA